MDRWTLAASRWGTNPSRGRHPGGPVTPQHAGRLSGLQFSKDGAESKEGSEALSAAGKKFKLPSSENLGEIAEHCNERKCASCCAEEAGQKLYMWALIKRKEMERRIHYDEVESLSIEWLEATGTLVLEACRNRPPKGGEIR
uniref:Uncharacterized protein n=1 Tax=Oryza punctata TaxID=4537 RepID=A0A0E0MH48_ORYPU